MYMNCLFFVLMLTQSTRSTRTDTVFPDTTHFRSIRSHFAMALAAPVTARMLAPRSCLIDSRNTFTEFPAAFWIWVNIRRVIRANSCAVAEEIGRAHV